MGNKTLPYRNRIMGITNNSLLSPLVMVIVLALVSEIQPQAGASTTRKFRKDLATKCLPGNHPVDSKCISNKKHCVDGYYDQKDHNCAKCKWFAHWVENDIVG